MLEKLLILVRELSGSLRSYVGSVANDVTEHLAEAPTHLQARVVNCGTHTLGSDGFLYRLCTTFHKAHGGHKLLKNLCQVFTALSDKQLRLLSGDIVRCVNGINGKGYLSHTAVIDAALALPQ